MASNDTNSDITTETANDRQAPEGSAEAPADALAPAAPRKRASRRVTKKAAAPRVSAPTDETSAAGPVAEEGAAERAADGAAPSTTPESMAESATEPVAEQATEQAATPAKRTPRKRASRKRAAEPAAEPEQAASAALEELVAEVLPTLEEQSPESRDEAAPDGAEESAQDTDDVEEAGLESAAPPAAVVPSFSVLFQAPEPARATPARRRRATAPAQEPASHAPAEEEIEPFEPEAEDQLEAEAPETEPGDDETAPRRSRRRRGGKGRRGRAPGESGDNGEAEDAEPAEDLEQGPDEEEATEATEGEEEVGEEEGGTTRRRRRRRRAGSSGTDTADDTPNVSTRVRQPRATSDEPVAVKGSTRLEAKKQRRREGREAGRRRTIITEAEFLARREAVDRVMVVRNKDGRTQVGVLEDGVLVEHYIDQATTVSMAGNIYLGRVQNVLPSMEAAFVDIGKGRNAVLYAGEVNWDAAGLESNQPKRIENALSSGQTVLVQVTKDPIGHKGARLTSQISLPGRYLVYVPNSSMTGISRKLPDTERARLKKILRDVVPDSAGVIVRTAAEGASEEELRADVERLTATWEDIQARAEASSSGKAGKSKGRKKNGGTGSSTTGTAPLLLHGEPDLTVRVIRDVFNEDFKQLIVSGDQAWQEIHPYITSVAPDLAERVTKWTSDEDLFAHHRVDEQLAKAMDRKVWLPSGGSLVIDRTEAMTVVDVNTGKFVGSGGNLEETVTKNNIEAAEEIVRQLRLRDIGGIIVIDFIDMVLESNRELVVRRLLECLGRDRTKHQVAEVTSLGLVQMTRKRVGSGLIEVFSETCDHCNGRGFIIHTDPVDKGAHAPEQVEPVGGGAGRSRRGGRGSTAAGGSGASVQANQQNGGAAQEPKHSGPTAAQIAAAAHAAAIKGAAHGDEHPDGHVDGPALATEDHPEDHPEDRAAVASAGHEDGQVHAFPDDSGPWPGDEEAAQATDRGERGVEPGVELESDVPDALGESVEPAPEPVHPTATEPAPEPAAEPAAAPRGRRRRGRVVAPAGPPRHAANAGDGPGSVQP